MFACSDPVSEPGVVYLIEPELDPDTREPRNLFSRFHVPVRYDVVLSAEASD